jgi:hypothetical protein
MTGGLLEEGNLRMSHEYIEYSSFDELCADSAYYDDMFPETHQTECLQCPEPPNVEDWIRFYVGLQGLPGATVCGASKRELSKFFQSTLDTE